MTKKNCYKLEIIYKPNNLVERTNYVYAFSLIHAKNIGSLILRKLYGRSTKHIIKVSKC